MKMKAFVFLSLFLASAPLFAIGIQGGDGPTPFSRTPAPKKFSISLEGGVSSYSILESIGKVAYLDSSRLLRVYDFNQERETLVGSFESDLMPMASPDGRTVLSRDLKTLKTVGGHSKGQEIRLPTSKEFILWEKNELYLLKGLERIKHNAWKVTYLVYQESKNQVSHRNCYLQASKNPKSLKLAKGFSPLDLVLYSEEPHDGDTELKFYSINLKSRNGNCSLELHSSQSDLVRGNITSVNWFSDRQELVVLTDHESSNLYLGKSGALTLASLPAGRSYIPNPKSPIVVNINRQKGIGVYSLVTGRYFTLELSVDRGLLEGNQIWVTSDAEQLYVSAREQRQKQNWRTLHTVSLKGIN